MADIASDMRRAYELKGDTYSSMEVFGMLSRGADEIERLTAALEKVRSYNVDIAAGRINYRPEDHIQVIDRALYIHERQKP